MDLASGASSFRINLDNSIKIRGLRRKREKIPPKENIKRKSHNMEQEDKITASTQRDQVLSDIFGIPGLKRRRRRR